MMKKMMMAAVAALMLQSCGMTNPGVNGGSQMGGTTTNNSGSSIGSNALGGLLDLVVGSVKLSQADIIGTWSYVEPACAFTSENLLAKAGGSVAALIMGGVVCTALSMAGGFITDLKIGYWLGTTPKKQETWKFLGTLVSAATVGGVMMLLNHTYGFASGQLAAPQANAMAAVIDPLMNGVRAPWELYGLGALIAIVLTYFKIPALAFALGMFIPLELNTPLLVGGAINWFVTSRSKNVETNKARGEKGTLIASGFIAGGALMGVVSALLRFCGVQFDYTSWWSNPWSEVVSLVAYALLIVYFVWATKVKK